MGYLLLRPIGLELARLLSNAAQSADHILRDQLGSVDALAVRHGESVEDTRKLIEGLIILSERGQLMSVLGTVVRRETEARLPNRRYQANEVLYKVVFQDDDGLVPELHAFVFLKSDFVDGKLFHFFTSAEAFRHGESDEAVFCFADELEPDFFTLGDAVLQLSRCADDSKDSPKIDTRDLRGSSLSIRDRGLVPKGNGETHEWYLVSYYANDFGTSEESLIREASDVAEAARREADRLGFERLIVSAYERPRHRGAVTRTPRSFRYKKCEGAWLLVES